MLSKRTSDSSFYYLGDIMFIVEWFDCNENEEKFTINRCYFITCIFYW